MALGFLQQRTESAKRARDAGDARAIAAFKQLAARIGIKLPDEPKPAKKAKARVRRR